MELVFSYRVAREHSWLYSGLFAGALALGVLVIVLRVVRLRSAFAWRISIGLIGAGVFIIVGVTLVVCALTGFPGSWLPFPFMPSLIGLFSIGTGLVALFEQRYSRFNRVASPTMVACFAAAVISVNLYRLQQVQSIWGSYDAAAIAKVSQTSQQIASILDGRSVFWMWIGGYMDPAKARYYAVQQGLVPFGALKSELEQPRFADMSIEDKQAAMLKMIRTQAPFVIVSKQLSQYEGAKRHIFFEYSYGRPIVEALLADPKFEPIFTYEDEGFPFVLLRNNGPKQ